MKKALITAACALLLSTSLATAQSSQGKGGAPMTGETAAKGSTATGDSGMMKKQMKKTKMKKMKKSKTM